MDGETAIVRRNRQNSLKSTGPKTKAGKAIAKRNHLRHGLRANPASLDGEDGRQFNALLRQLVEEVRPRGAIEQGLVHRIAVLLWRLQRATRVDCAVSSLGVRDVAPLREEAQDWMERVNACWHVEFVQVLDPALLRQRRAEGRLGPEQIWVRCVRYGIRGLDRLRADMKRSGAGVTAMMAMLDDLVDQLIRWPQVFRDDSREKLAWLLSAPAAAFWIVEPGDALPGEEGRGSPILSLIPSIEEQRKPGEELPRQLDCLIRSRRETLRQQRNL